MRLFGRSKEFEATMFASSAMTYGQAVEAITQAGGIPPEESQWLMVNLRDVVQGLALRMDGTEFFLPLFDTHYPLGRLPGDDLHLPDGGVVQGTEEAVDGLCGLLNMRFNQPIGRDEALEFCREAVRGFAQQAPHLLSTDRADLCGLATGLAMKTIQEDTLRSRRKEREARLVYGGLIGSWWAAKALQQ